MTPVAGDDGGHLGADALGIVSPSHAPPPLGAVGDIGERWASPVMTLRCTAATDFEIGGQAIRAAEKVVMFYPAGDWDTEVFEHPERLDLGRSPNPHASSEPTLD